VNDRLGRFGKRELTAVTTLCTLLLGCFSTDEASQFQNGNMLHYATAIALLLSLGLLELGLYALKRAHADGLGEWIARLPKWIAAALSLLLSGVLVLSAVLPEVRFLRAMTDFIYIDAAPVSIAVYLLPCLAVLTMLGMETLSRTGRVLLPITLLAAIIGLASDVPLYRLYRLYPLFTDIESLLRQSAGALLRFVPVVLLLLTVARGAQGLDFVRSAGRTGLLLGGAITLLAELALGLSYHYTELQSLTAPLYRLMVEIDTDNAAIRLDRVVLFAWTMAGQFAAACSVYGASLLLVQANGIGDVRPIALLLSAVTVTTALVLREADAMGSAVLSLLHRYGWIVATVPTLLLFLTARRIPCEN